VLIVHRRVAFAALRSGGRFATLRSEGMPPMNIANRIESARITGGDLGRTLRSAGAIT